MDGFSPPVSNSYIVASDKGEMVRVCDFNRTFSEILKRQPSPNSAMNVGWVNSSLMLIISLSVGANCIYPHHLGFRLKPNQQNQISKTEESVKIRNPEPHTSSKSKSRSRETKQRNPSVVYCFASHCDVECSTVCISISRATGRPVPVGKLTAPQAKQRKERKSTSGSFLKLVTEGLLKKISLTALVRRLTITEEGRRGRQMGRMQKITRVQ